jgi:tetratricopeptide (TPR) repeat protein
LFDLEGSAMAKRAVTDPGGVLTGIDLAKSIDAHKTEAKRPKLRLPRRAGVADLQRAGSMFVSAKSWGEARLIVKSFNLLLTDEGETCVRLALAMQSEPDQRAIHQKRLCFLQRSREVGPDTALDEFTGFVSSPIDIIDAFAMKHPDLIDQVTDGGSQPFPKMWADIFAATAQKDLRTLADQILGHAVPSRGGSISSIMDRQIGKATTALERYLGTKKLEDLDAFVSLTDQIIKEPDFLSAEDDLKLPFLANAGQARFDRYRLSGSTTDFAIAMEIWQSALNVAPDKSPHLGLIYYRVGEAQWHYYEKSGDLRYLEAAIQAKGRAAALTPSWLNDFTVRVVSCAAALLEQGRQVGGSASLEQAIGFLETHLAHISKLRRNRPVVLSNLAGALMVRFHRSRQTADLDRAIELWDEALRSGAPQHALIYLTNIGRALDERFLATRRDVNLDDSIRAYQKALRYARETASLAEEQLSLLAGALHKRFLFCGNLADLVEAIEHGEEALAMNLETSTRCTCYAQMCEMLVCQFQATRRRSALRRAIIFAGKGVELARSERTVHGRCAIALASALRQRYRLAGRSADAQRAVKVLHAATSSSSAAGSDLRLWVELGAAFWDLYSHTEEMKFLEDAIAAWSEAWSAILERVESESAEAKLYGSSILDTVAEGLVKANIKLWQRGASAAAVSRALEIAEAIKFRVFNNLLAYEAAAAPSSIPPELSAREMDLTNKLKSKDAHEYENHDRPMTVWSIRRDPEYYDELREELRQIHQRMCAIGGDAAEYVRLRRGDSLSWDDYKFECEKLTPGTLVIAQFITENTTYLFLLSQDCEDPIVLTAEGLGREVWNDVLRRLRREVSACNGFPREETWDLPIRALLVKLTPHLKHANRVVISPHGVGYRLPWTAALLRAGVCRSKTTPVPCIMVTSLTLLRTLRERPPSGNKSAIVIGDPIGDLPHAREEATLVAALLGTKPLLGQHADVHFVTPKLASASVIHFAAHAFYSAWSPLDSAVLLAFRRPLSARRIMEGRLNADLVVLSGCETGTSGHIALNETVGLLTAFIFAGARSVLVSLWPVNDRATGQLMQGFYRHIGEGQDPIEALANAMGALRRNRRWSHSYFWSAFTLVSSPTDMNGRFLREIRNVDQDAEAGQGVGLGRSSRA